MVYPMDAVNRRLQPGGYNPPPYQVGAATPQQPNQFTMPVTGGPDQPPVFGQIPTPQLPGGGGGGGGGINWPNYPGWGDFPRDKPPGAGGGGGGGQDNSRLYDPTYGGPIDNPYSPVGAKRAPYPGIEVSPNGTVMGTQQPVPQLAGVTQAPAIEAGQSANARAPSGGTGPTTTRTAAPQEQERQRQQQNGGGGGGGGGGGSPQDKSGGGGGGNQQSGGGGGGNQQPNPADNGAKGSLNPANDPHLGTVKAGAFIQGGRDMKGYSDKETKWLGKDATLDAALRGLVAAQGDYSQQYNTEAGNIGDAFRSAIQDIHRQKGEATVGLNNQAASSGLIRSSGFGTELGNMTADFARQAGQAREGKTSALSDLLAERQNYMRELETQRTALREEALRRYAIHQMDVAGLINYTQTS